MILGVSLLVTPILMTMSAVSAPPSWLESVLAFRRKPDDRPAKTHPGWVKPKRAAVSLTLTALLACAKTYLTACSRCMRNH